MCERCVSCMRVMVFFFFFFSSRRRHTRCGRDWSSDVCSSDLSRVRANLVKEGTLHQIALRLQLPDLLRLGEGESKSGGKQRPSILADAVEALIGAVYLDAGYAAGEKVVHHLFEGLDINPHMRAAA